MPHRAHRKLSNCKNYITLTKGEKSQDICTCENESLIEHSELEWRFVSFDRSSPHDSSDRLHETPKTLVHKQVGTGDSLPCNICISDR